MESRNVAVYCFEQSDGKTPEQRLRETLRDWTGPGAAGPEASGEIFRGERGKPYLRNLPGTGLSITHSGPYWVCALADTGLGTDLQEHALRRGETAEEAAARYRKMAVRFFHGREADYVLEGDSFRRFFRVWAAKEAYVKYTGRGIDDAFGEFCVVPEKREPDFQKPVFSQGTPGGPEAFVLWRACGVWFAGADVAGDGRGGIQVCGKNERPEYTLCVCGPERWKPEIRRPAE